MCYTIHGQLADVGQKRQKEMGRKDDSFLRFIAESTWEYA